MPGRIPPGHAVVAAALAALALQACAGPRSAAEREGGELLVAVAISLAPAVKELAARYEADHPGTVVRLDAGASGVLLQQVRRGAPVDLFLSASPDELERLAEEGRVDRGSAVGLGHNRLVIVTASDAPAPGDGAPRLDAYATIAVGNPRTAPLGRYTREALEALGVWEAVRARTIVAENARQVVEYVARGEAEAGIVYLSDAVLLVGRVRRGPLLDEGLHRPIAYRGAVLAGAPRAAAAAAFLRFLRSPQAAQVLARHGLAPPSGAP